MKKNYERLFKFEPLENDIFRYVIYRKSLFWEFQKVGTAKIVSSENVSINFQKSFSSSEQQYIKNYFYDLAALKVVSHTNNSFMIYRRLSDCKFESVAIANENSSYELIALKSLKPHECVYLRNLIRNKLKQ